MQTPTSRPCAAAGSFYSEDKNKLSAQVKNLLQEATLYPDEEVQALIVPHAGYLFSAPIAATAYKTLHKRYKNIFLIGSSHHVSFNGASLYNLGNYQTPLGEVKVNQEIVSKLLRYSNLFTYRPNAHDKEHTLEVQLPFLQTIYEKDLTIVPIIMATSELRTIIEISEVLKPYMNDENLFVISTDLSHYPAYEDAQRVDHLTLEALCKNSPQAFINAILENENLQIENLQTSACGWSSLLLLLYMTHHRDLVIESLQYKNSGDTHYGDKDRVVGYGAMRVYKKSVSFILTPKEKKKLLQVARDALNEATINNKRIEIDESSMPSKFKEHLGAFVTLNKEGALRGCIGTFEPTKSLLNVIIDMAISAAQNDTRFMQVTQAELESIEIEISVLTPRKRVYSLDEIVLGRDGIYIKKGFHSGTFLPHVATQMHWSVEEFVGHCAQEKAEIGYDGYKDAELFTYEAIVFSESEVAKES